MATIGYIFNPKKKSGEEEKEYPKLTDHHIFTRLAILKNQVEMSFTLKNKGKEALFKDMLLTHLDVWGDNVMKLATQLEECDNDIDGITFENIILNHFEKGLKDFSNYYKNSNFTYDEQVGLDLVMAKFNKWNYPRTKMFRETLLVVCNSQFYMSQKVKSAVILDMYISHFVDTISDAELTINDINGDLKGLVYKGITI